MTHPGRSLALGTLLLLATAPATVAESLSDRLLPMLESHRGKVAVYVKQLQTGEQFSYQADEPMPTASLIKLPVMVEALRQVGEGNIALDDVVTVRQEDMVPGSGILTRHFTPGATITLRDAMRLMIVYSDNTATNLVADAIGIAATGQQMKQLGLQSTALHSKVYRGDTTIDPEGSKRYGIGVTTAAEIGQLLEMIQCHQVLDATACDLILDDLKECEDRAKIARFLPRSVVFANKTGYVGETRTDAGILYAPDQQIVVAVLTTDNADTSGSDTNEAEILCGRIGQAVFQHFNPYQRSEAASGNVHLTVGASGTLVRDLQRTLNARLETRGRLSLDGEFGPATRAAVVAFQQANQLEPTGEVRGDTWAALGDLLTTDEPVPTPDEVNGEVLSVEPPLPLDGPPVVSAQAWAIVRASDGQLLWGSEADTPREMASLTKTMTALTVLHLTQDNPDRLQQRISTTSRADAVGGSSADLRTGEQVTVSECLYGLMLPSGNDAAHALAEHCGRWTAADGETLTDAESYDRFMEAMNQLAQSLGMEKSTYKNPHGLPAAGHQASAADLARVAIAAAEHDLLWKIMGSRQRGATLSVPDGYQRHVVWKNTNALLGMEGFSGVKTGYTEAAGHCFVCWGDGPQREALVVVVLGAPSAASRDVDTKNLFRYAWNELKP